MRAALFAAVAVAAAVAGVLVGLLLTGRPAPGRVSMHHAILLPAPAPAPVMISPASVAPVTVERIRVCDR